MTLVNNEYRIDLIDPFLYCFYDDQQRSNVMKEQIGVVRFGKPRWITLLVLRNTCIVNRTYSSSKSTFYVSTSGHFEISILKYMNEMFRLVATLRIRNILNTWVICQSSHGFDMVTGNIVFQEVIFLNIVYHCQLIVSLSFL